MKNKGTLAALLPLLPLLLLLTPSELLLLTSAVLLHEGGHLAALALLGEPAPTPRAVLLGLTLTVGRPLSYRRELLVAAAGPLANLLLALPLLTLGREEVALCALGAVHALTGIVNLLPLGRCDGARILFCGAALLVPLSAAERISRAAGHIALLFLLFSLLYLLLGNGGAGALILILPLLFRAHGTP